MVTPPPTSPARSSPSGQRRFDEMTSGSGIFAVAEVDGQLAASGFLDFEDEDLQPEVKNLWVFPEFRRHGAGHALWTWPEEQAREAGHKEVFLSVAPDNVGAIGLFLNLGYAPTGDHTIIDNPAAHVVADPAPDQHPLRDLLQEPARLLTLSNRTSGGPASHDAGPPSGPQLWLDRSPIRENLCPCRAGCARKQLSRLILVVRIS